MIPDPWPLRSHLELGALPTAVPCARLHARQMLWEWGLNGLAETAELLVSELVTNAVKATAGYDRLLPIRLHLSSDKERLLIEVWDVDPRPPVLTGLGEDGIPALGNEGGRGVVPGRNAQPAVELVRITTVGRQGRLVRNSREIAIDATHRSG